MAAVKVGHWVSGKYRLLRRIGAGGMGEVWAVRNELTNRDFAIKVLLSELAERDDAVSRFIREARATGQLKHPNLVSVFDAGRTDDGRPYLVMELLSGESLEQRLQRDRRLSPLSTCVILSQVAWALHAAHQAGVVHRDLSSANVFLTGALEAGEPVPKILDFGVSKIMGPVLDGRSRTADGAILGCPVYMSPEQAQGTDFVDARTDVWALGVLLYECLAGRRPYDATNYNALMYAILNVPHQPLLELLPALDPQLARVVDDCLIKDRDSREFSAKQVAERLERVAWRLSAGGAGLRPTPRRRATDRLSVRPEDYREPPPALAHAGLSPRVIPAGVRCWNAFTRRRSGAQLIALASALVGAGVGVTLGIMMTVAAHDPAPRLLASPVAAPAASHGVVAARGAAPVASVAAGPGARDTEPSSETLAARAPERPSEDLVGSVGRALGVTDAQPEGAPLQVSLGKAKPR